MLLKGVRQKRMLACAVLKGGNFDLLSPTKGHKNQQKDFITLAAHTLYFQSTVPPEYKLIKASNELRLT